jgi:geranylgeranyl diphosphate synthase type II
MKNYSGDYNRYRLKIDEILNASVKKNSPFTLYDPLKYLLGSGGKRIRPVLLIFSCEAAGGKMEDALNAGAAIELLHNFTLVHDDIMDCSDTRRGRQTIHKKWNENVAILSGDHLIGMAYTYLLDTKSDRLSEITKIFTEGIIEVCEGQSYDKEFEERKDVTVGEYLMMIGKKTAKMLEISAVIGAIIGNAGRDLTENFKVYANNIGIAFQILDDLLDINSTEAELGKRIGGDLVEGKKTYLLLKAAETVSDKNDLSRIRQIISDNGLKNPDDKSILEIKNIFQRHGIIDDAKKEIEKYTLIADSHLNSFPEGESKDRMKWFSNMLMSRSF